MIAEKKTEKRTLLTHQKVKGQMSIGCRSGVDRASVVCRSGVGRVSVGCRSGVGRVSVDDPKFTTDIFGVSTLLPLSYYLNKK